MLDKLPSRLPHTGATEPDYYALLSKAAWSIPTVNPFLNPTPEPFRGDVGRIGPAGFAPEFSNQEIAFLLGACSGVFYRTEVVRVIRWPFRQTIPGHNYKWCAVGLGTITAWATGTGSEWTITPGSSIGGGPVPAHRIVAYSGTGTLGQLDAFPGKMAPLAANEVTLTSQPAQFKWCAAEGLFYPIVQVPG